MGPLIAGFAHTDDVTIFEGPFVLSLRPPASDAPVAPVDQAHYFFEPGRERADCLTSAQRASDGKLALGGDTVISQTQTTQATDDRAPVMTAALML